MNKNRLSIYFFYDKDGIVDEYIFHTLSNLKEFSKEIIFVVNGNLNQESEHKLKNFASHIYIRENSGFDVYAYKYALEKYGYDNLAEFDEIILTNFTSYGPIYPFDDLFDRMNKSECDFWGIAKHPQKIDVEGKKSIVYHVQSYFVAYRKSLLSSPLFKEYWDSTPEINSYDDSVYHHELRQTPFFEYQGFKSDSYIDIQKYKEHFHGNAVIEKADKQLIEDKSPLLKRRVLFIFGDKITSVLLRVIVKYIIENTEYDIGLIYDNIKRTQNIDRLPEKFKYPIKAFKYKLFAMIFPHKKGVYMEKYKRLRALNPTRSEFNGIFNK